MKTSRWILSLAFLIVTAIVADAATLSVPDAYPTIQAAIDAAKPGDTVQVKTGDYAETVTLKSGVSLLGEGSEKSIVTYDGSKGVTLAGKDCVDCTVKGIAFKQSAATDIKIDDAARKPVCEISGGKLQFSDCTISGGSADGIRITNGAEVLVALSTFHDNDSAGIRYQGGAKGRIERTASEKNGLGIGIADKGTDVVISECGCNSNRGCGVFSANNATISAEKNVSNGNGGSGIRIDDNTVHAVLKGNSSEQNAYCGIWIAPNAYAEWDKNVVTRNGEISKRELNDLLEHEEYKQLEEIANRLRKDKVRFESGEWQLDKFYEFLTSNCDRMSAAEEKVHLSRISDWGESFPDSITWRLVLAESYREFGWRDRGGGVITTVSREQFRSFQEYLAKAQDTLDEIAGRHPDDPQYYADRVTQSFEYQPARASEPSILPGALEMLARALSAWWNPTPDPTRVSFEQGIAFDPSYYPLYYTRARGLLPRWRGNSTGTQMVAFADEADKSTEAIPGAAMYARIATEAYRYDGMESLVSGYQFSWPRIKKGYESIMATFPKSNYRRNYFCVLACLYHDKATAAAQFGILGDAWDAEVWSGPSAFAAWKKWSLQNGPVPGETQLARAIANDDEKGAKEALKKGDDANSVSAEGFPLLYVAVQRYDAEIVRELIRAGAKVNDQFVGGETMLFYALDNNSTEVLRALLDGKANPNSRDSYGWTLLSDVIAWGRAEPARILIDSGADINLTSPAQMTPLHVAARNHQKNIAQLLLNKGADLNARNSDGYTPLVLAAHQADLEMCEVLFEKNADPNATSPDGWSALFEAADNGSVELAKYLVSKGARVDQVQNDGWSIYHMAAKAGSTEVLAFLLDTNPKALEIRTKEGRSLLQQAAKDGRLECVELLVDRGADLNYRNPFDSHSALEYAQNGKHDQIVKYLVAHGVKE